ncbi:hypothetical protein [Butyrivibrio sp. WCE2006]|uniref:hypothetical protein n=1 Tax=Butyrivibrio sp. WCE2006 TaxID=1410611 RepID=UPI000679746A|nr:hypothetical protein [Butyrivibrio sp. WCE2006]
MNSEDKHQKDPFSIHTKLYNNPKKIQLWSVVILIFLLFVVFVIGIISKPISKNDDSYTEESSLEDDGQIADNSNDIEATSPLTDNNETSEAPAESNEPTEEEIENNKKAESLDDYYSLIKEYNQMISEYNVFVSEYNSTIDQLTKQNNILDDGIRAAQAAIEDERTPYDLNTRIQLRNALRDSRNHFTDVPPRTFSKAPMASAFIGNTAPEELELATILDENAKVNDDISALSEEIQTIQQNMNTLPVIPDNTTVADNLIKLAGEYLDSIEVLEQVTAPKESFITERLGRVSSITGMQAVTLDHDPNEHLGKPGWYTSCVYFTVSYIDPDSIEGSDIVDKGTVAGGAIEVYETNRDAQNREKDLSAYDDTLLNPGSRYIVGSILIRTSKKLTHDQQVNLTLDIANEFTYLD